MRDKLEITPKPPEGILLVDKPEGVTSFSLIPRLRRLTKIEKIGHGGTLDPFATGVMIFLIGKSFTVKADSFIQYDKEYLAKLHLGQATDTHDTEGQITFSSLYVPSLEEIHQRLEEFQGEVLQIPPMFSAKKINGQKLYDLARKGIEVKRAPVQVTMKTTLISYDYPYLTLHVSCSKGTYIRTIADDLGKKLTSGAYLENLTRLRVGPFELKSCIPGALLYETDFDYTKYLL